MQTGITAELGDFTPTTLVAMADDLAEAIDNLSDHDPDYRHLDQALRQVVNHLRDSEGDEFVAENVRCPEA